MSFDAVRRLEETGPSWRKKLGDKFFESLATSSGKAIGSSIKPIIYLIFLKLAGVVDAALTWLSALT